MKHTRILSLSLAALLAASTLAACQQQTQPDWREEVNSALSKETTTKSDRPNIQTSTAVTTTAEPEETTIPLFVEFPPKTVTVVKEPESYTNENAGKIHPISNPDELPEICIGNMSYLLYQNKIYHTYRSGPTFFKELVSVDLSEMVSYDPTADQYTCPIPESMSVCTDPFCSHGDANCPATFSEAFTFPIYCIDYEESAGRPPVFYVMAAEPAYIQVGEQQVTQKVEDSALYRYDTQTGEREMLVQDLPKMIYGFAVGGGYIYYSSRTGLVALDRSGKEVAHIGEEDNCHYIITMDNGRLFYCDAYGKLYSAKPDLSDVKLEYEPDLTNMSETVAIMISSIGHVPFGYRVADGYAYYCDDFVREEIIAGYDLKSTSIYRLNLNDPSAEPELLVKNGCWSMHLLGVAGGKLYYEPNIYYENGSVAKTIAVVDLSTLEIEMVAENEYTIPHTSSGLSFDDVVLTSKFILGTNVKDMDFYLIYHFETGDLMCISNEFDCGKIVKE